MTNKVKMQNGTMKFNSGDLLPPGVIMPYGGAAAPSDSWLICDGSIISRTTYADLYANVGDAFGNGDGSTTFHLPDFRGRFLRGADDGEGNDPDAAGRTAMNTGGNTGDNVGSIQVNATAKNGLTATTGINSVNHSHVQTKRNHTDASGAYSAGTSNSGGAAASADSTGGVSVNHNHIVTVGAGDNETRPINAYVNYIIKAK